MTVPRYRPFRPFKDRHGAEQVPEATPSYTMERHIASLRDEDPARWAELQAEWRDK